MLVTTRKKKIPVRIHKGDETISVEVIEVDGGRVKLRWDLPEGWVVEKENTKPDLLSSPKQD